MRTQLSRIAAAVGLGIAALVLNPAVYAAEPATAGVVDAFEVSNDQMVSWYQQGQLGKEIWLFDSRPTGKFITGHIPGAISLPLDVLKKDSAAVIEKYAIPKTSKVVFYCAGRECTLSIDSAEIFRKLGYAEALVYRNGVPGWNQKMQPLLAEEAFIKKGNLIVLDLGVGKETLVAPGIQTLQLSLKALASDQGKSLLADLSRNAPLVVLARDDMGAVDAALEELRDQDFRRLAYFPLSAWQSPLAAAGPLVKAHWAPVYGPGQISPKEFEQAVASGQTILDVRPAADFARGHFKNSMSLPVEDLEKDWAKIPVDRTVYIHCATGAKSAKAFDILGRKGVNNVKYLDAEVSCKGQDCTIKE